ncbi:MFS transporter [Lactococcus lactis subsp. lactis]|uniref:MFS transporter n=1 Tax=Lactococcus lactis TaxID=1358 RepID=UPI001BA9294C|nr:MFS transporter [Lactococcus lactis]MBR8675137.1 MFS transporter [Lactococcus lactis subsp. lactis]MBR8677921.1 MFS transporter [Lactococcus lactis subsp. lactis]MBR8685420.1 MFS transporter [Lactococcus lactis subsp. lactis]
MNLLRKNKTFASLLSSSIFSMLGTSLFNIVFLIYASSMPHPKMMISLAELCLLLPIIFAAYTGFLADRTKNKANFMIRASWIQAVLFFLLIFLMMEKNWISFWSIAGVKILTDLITSYKSGLRAPILQNNLSAEEIQPAFGQIQGLSSIIEIIGQPLGVTILALSHQSFSLVVLINGILYLLSGFFLLIFRKKLTFKTVNFDEKFKFNIKESFSQIRDVFTVNSSSNFLVLVFSLVFINFILAGIGPLTSLAMLKFNPFSVNYGIAIMIFNVVLMLGMLAGSFIMGDKLKDWELPKLMIATFLMISLFAALVTHFGLISLIFLFSLAYISAKASPKVNRLILENVSSENLGKIGGGITTIFTFSVPFGGAIFVFFANLIGIALTFYIISILSLLVFLILLLIIFRQ